MNGKAQRLKTTQQKRGFAIGLSRAWKGWLLQMPGAGGGAVAALPGTTALENPATAETRMLSAA